MTYTLGVDLGTTYTAAAVARTGPPGAAESGLPPVEVVPLGDHEAAVPTVLRWPRDGDPVVGEPAERRAATSPGSTSREFKRRLGDPTPLMLDGVPRAPEALLAQVLRWVVDRVAEREGTPAEAVVVTHPANWGGFRRELLEQAVTHVGVTGALLVTEPEAAALRYATTERVVEGDTVGVYDLGGGTFDAAVVRRTATAFELLGQPAGIEHLGGLDVDQAVFAHVQDSIEDGVLDELDPDDLAVTAALYQLRRDCVLAKETLSYDTEALVPVNLPGVHTVVRITRGELEERVKPLVDETVHAFRRALASAGVSAAGLTSVLLVGGASRMPLVAQTLSGELGRPVAVDAHPKHVVALGAALWATSRVSGGSPGPVATPLPAPAAAPAVQVAPVPAPTPAPAQRAPATTSATAPPAERTGAAPMTPPVQREGRTGARPVSGPPPGGPSLGGPSLGGPSPGGPPTGTDPPTRTARRSFLDELPPTPPTPRRGARLLAQGPALGRRPDALLAGAGLLCLGLLLTVSTVGLGGHAEDVRIVNVPTGPGAAVALDRPLGLVTPDGALLTRPEIVPRMAGIDLPGSSPGRGGTANLSSGQYLVAGDVLATVTWTEPARGGTRREGRTVLRADGGLLTVPGIAAAALLLFALAYAESLLRPVRRRRRTRALTLAGMAGVGAAFGVAVALLGWALLWPTLTLPYLLVAALLGDAAALALTVLLSRRDPST